MHLPHTIDAVLDDVAARHKADMAVLRSAIERDSAADLALILGIDREDAQGRLADLERVLTVQGDIGAGCVLLTDTIDDELVAMIAGW